jgi:hypothetical protein
MAVSLLKFHTFNLPEDRNLRCLALLPIFYFLILCPTLGQIQATTYPKEWTVLFGAGVATATDIGTRHLSQEIDGFDTYRYRAGVSASVNYAWHRRWSTSLGWNRGGSVVKWTVPKSKKIKEITTILNAFSLVFERRFAIRKDQYFYSGFGLGVYHLAKEKTYVYEPPSRNTRLATILVLKPIGMCVGLGRAKAYLEMGLFTLPIVSGGIKIRL